VRQSLCELMSSAATATPRPSDLNVVLQQAEAPADLLGLHEPYLRGFPFVKIAFISHLRLF